MPGTILAISVAPGQEVQKNQVLVILEAMKMEHVVASRIAGVVREICATQDETLLQGAVLLIVDVVESESDRVESAQAIDPDQVRPDLADRPPRIRSEH